MNVLFLNSFEKSEGEGRRMGAGLTVAEKDGEFIVSWTAVDGDAAEAVWYQGTAWNDAVSALRMGLQERMREGWTPLFTVPELSGAAMGGPYVSRRTQLLQFYAELHAETELLGKLRSWRKSAASKEGIAPYIIASNRTLDMLGAYAPQTLDELKQIPGFGNHRIEKYGESVLALTAGQTREHGFPLDWVERVVDEEAFTRWQLDQRAARLSAAEERKAKRQRLLQSIAEGADLSEIAERTTIERRDLVREIELLEREGYDVEPVVARVLADVPDEDALRAATLLQELGDRFLKPIVERLYTAEQLKAAGADRVYEWVRLLRIRHRAAIGAAAGTGAEKAAG